jgi:hypothetical protein
METTAAKATGSALSSRSNVTSPTAAESVKPSALAQSSTARASAWMVETVYERFTAMFGHSFTSQYGTQPNGIAGDTWAAVLAGLSGEQVALGLREAVKLGSDWPPSAPRFRMLCLNIPSLAAVRLEFTAHRSPFARKLWQFIDSYAFGRADSDKSERMFRDAYDLTREYVMGGGALDPAPLAAIEAENPAPIKPATEEIAKKNINEILQNLKKAKPYFVTAERKYDVAANRTLVVAVLSDGQKLRLPWLDSLAISDEQIIKITNEEIERIYGGLGE